ncbi:MAG TPA: FAD binding domain-containing protein [Anaerolineales bacterium]
MITSYHRPQTLEEALKLLSAPNTRPFGGGTLLSHPSDESFAVVDLQAIGLDKLHKSGNNLEIGATVTLQTLLESPHTPAALRAALKLEAPLNLRNMGTVAGTLVTCDGRSPFAAVMLALDAKLTVVSVESSVVSLGDFLPLRVGADGVRPGTLITNIKIPLNAKLAFETVARTLDDKPIVCAALAQWPAGRTRLVIGGWGKAPTLALDGNEPSGVEDAARNAAHDAADQWASAEYRSAVAGVLAKRSLERLQ